MTWNIIEEKKDSGTGRTSVSVTFDTAPAEGEVLFFELFSQLNAAVFTPPSGVTALKTIQSGSARTVATFLKIAGAGESATFTFTADSSSAMGMIAKRVSCSDGTGSQAAITLNAIGIQYSTSVTSLSTPDMPVPAGAFVIATAYSNGTLDTLSGGFGTPSLTTAANGGVLVSATKTSTGAVEKLTQNLTAGNTRQVVMLTALLPAPMQALKRAKVDIAGASSGVGTDGRYYNSLAMSSLATVSNMRNEANTADTGWSIATTNVVAHSSTGNAWTDDYFAQAKMQAFARLDRTADAAGQLTISGLDNSKTYGLIFAGHIGSASDFTDVTIGGVTKQFKAAVVPPDGRFAGFVATPSSGSIVIDLALPASGSQYAALSAVDIVEFPAGGVSGDLDADESGDDLFYADGGLALNGISETLRDTDTGAVLAEESGLIVTVRAASDSEATLYATTAGETDAGGVLQFSSTAIGDPGDYVYLSVEKSDNSRVAMFRVQVKDLNSL